MQPNLHKKKKKSYTTTKTTTISKIKKALNAFSNFLVKDSRTHTSLASLLLTAPRFLHSLLLLLSLITVYILILILLLCHYSLHISLKAMNPSEEFVEQGISQQVCIFSCPLSY